MSIPPNQFRRDHPWMRFVLMDSSAGPVPSLAKVTPHINVILKNEEAHAEAVRLQPTTYCVA